MKKRIGVAVAAALLLVGCEWRTISSYDSGYPCGVDKPTCLDSKGQLVHNEDLQLQRLDGTDWYRYCWPHDVRDLSQGCTWITSER